MACLVSLDPIRSTNTYFGAVKAPSGNFPNASPTLRYEIHRIAHTCDIPIAQLEAKHTHIWEDLRTFKDELWKIHQTHNRLEMPSPKAWEASKIGSSNVLRTATIMYATSKDDVLFKIKFNPLQLEPKSFRLARKFGANRFMTVKMPNIARTDILPQHLKSTTVDVLINAVIRWMNNDKKEFMGYKWVPLIPRDNRDSKMPQDRQDALPMKKLFLFATEGQGLEKITIDELVNWMIPLDQNWKEPACKLYQRIELGTSMTYATLVFTPAQIRRVGDIFATDDHCDDFLRDGTLDWSSCEYKSGIVMNDGCAGISQGAATLVWNKLRDLGLGPQEPMPSCFQGRIGPAKGIWYIVPGPASDIWIQMALSQEKFRCHEFADGQRTIDAERTTFEVIDWPREPKRSNLFLDSLPILEQRGVPRKALEEKVREAIERETEEWCLALRSNDALLEKLRSISSTQWTDQISAALKPAVQLRRMATQGFEIHQTLCMMEAAKQQAEWALKDVAGKFKVPIEKSTLLYCVADHYGCLKPDEVHVTFSSRLFGLLSTCPAGRDALVCRSPCLWESDIQRVRLVYKPELSHLVNVAVFPRTGPYPLAGKLQGGDYDGDKVWICWDTEIVESFLNAPWPTDTDKPEPAEFKIEVDKSKVKDVYLEGAANQADGGRPKVQKLLEKGWLAAFRPSLLGKVTNFATHLAYKRNSITDKHVVLMFKLHDLIIDAPKSGFTFTEESWRTVRRELLGPDGSVETPAYSKLKKGKAEKRWGTRIPYKSENIQDYLIFHVAHPCVEEMIGSLTSFPSHIVSDKICDIYGDLRKTGDRLTVLVLNDLERELKKIVAEFKQSAKVYPSRKKEHLKTAQNKFSDYKPTNSNEIIDRWLAPRFLRADTEWDEIKALALFCICEKDVWVWCAIAPILICRIKALLVDPDSELIVTSWVQTSRFKRVKRATWQGVEDNPDNFMLHSQSLEGYTTVELGDDYMFDPSSDCEDFDDAEILGTGNAEDSPMTETEEYYDASETVDKYRRYSSTDEYGSDEGLEHIIV